ncbi:hypothetical protein [Lysinibacter cavernae]|uniref:Uncharacterized protein n=1 Tax=Lysinibacter cavernae TaxID=1640652 RepID=A0A7X5R1J4_9MICO|nr:hypothetical protein [Lysinibacter cavernae]NIH53985.1 hypothetical protein [Lysinibacter cavernae]
MTNENGLDAPSAPVFWEALELLHENLASVVTGINECVEKFNSRDLVTSALLAWGDHNGKIADALTEAVNGINELMAEIAKFLSPGDPFQLIEIASSWVTVRKGLSGLTTPIETDFRAGKYWSGRVGDNYENLPALQATAVAAIGAKPKEFADALNSHAISVISVWFGICDSIASYMLDQTKNIAEFVSASPTKWLDIMPHIVNLVVTVLELVSELFIEFRDYGTDVFGAARDFKTVMSDASGTNRGKWPTLSMDGV